MEKLVTFSLNWLHADPVPVFVLVLAVVAGLAISCNPRSPEPGAPRDLRCEYQEHPLGMDVLQPRLSWRVNDSRRGAVQSAYQILVASSEKALAENRGEVWDSGKIDSDQSAHVPYAGPGLKSRERYYWKVRTWDQHGQVSPYSESAWWEMGLLSSDDWQARWIGKAIEKPPTKPGWPWGYWIWHPQERGIDKPVYFGKAFQVPAAKKIKTARLRATADNYFTAFLNSEEVGQGSKWTEIYEFDASQFLHSGDNLIAVRAANNLGEICGLLVSLKIEFDDGSSLLVNSDSTWTTTTEEQPGWTAPAFTEQGWKKVQVLEKYGGDQWGKIEGDAYKPPRSVLVRNDFTVTKSVSRARVYVTGLGSYVLHLNGQRVGKDRFTPGWTDYPTRIQYQTYDVTSLLKEGKNAVGAILGNLWWSSGLGWRGSKVYSDGPLRFLMQLVVDYADGSRETFVTDETWKTHDAPIVENSLYHGETYDARLELPGWDETNFDPSSWEPVIVLEPEKARLVAQQGPTIQVTQELAPVSVTALDSDRYVFDLGQNMVGWVRLKVKGEAGTNVKLRFAEVLNDDGSIYTENLRSARATDVYILRGDGTEIWEPDFTYHGFRYVEVSGYPGTPEKDAITGRVVHSAAPVIGHFSCSNDLLNKIQKNITWGQRGNMYSVPTDCPQRDERLGWMGDAQIFSPTACYNMNMARFFSKWLRDIIDCQDEDGAVHDVNPTIVVSGPAKPGWGDAVVVVPWVVYQFYGDKRILEESYEGMAAWVNYMKNHSKDYLYEQEGYGDWIAVVNSPKKPIGAAYFYYCTKLMAKISAIIGKNEEAEGYQHLAEKIAGAFNEKYLDKKTGQYEGTTQTANLLPLAFGITPEAFADSVMANVVKDVIAREYHPSTGFLGTAYLLPLLSQRGHHDLAYRVASQTTYPSWGYMVEKDATTIWELWNSDSEGPGMNSRNHFALGSVGEWYYGWLTGIRPDPNQPGFKRTIVAPHPAGDLTWAEASLETSYGPVKSRWQKHDGELTLEVTIPANTIATVHVPTLGKSTPDISESGKELIKNGESVAASDGLKFIRLEKDAAVFEVGAGSYAFVCQK